MVALRGDPYDLDGNLCHKATSWRGTSITNVMVDTWGLFSYRGWLNHLWVYDMEK